ncbi:hypothetical protein, partial [Streptobacillus felis]
DVILSNPNGITLDGA